MTTPPEPQDHPSGSISASPIPLRERLAEQALPLNESHRGVPVVETVVALRAFRDWLRAEAEELRELAKDADDRLQDGDPVAERHCERFRCGYEVLRARADAIDKELSRDS